MKDSSDPPSSSGWIASLLETDFNLPDGESFNSISPAMTYAQFLELSERQRRPTTQTPLFSEPGLSRRQAIRLCYLIKVAKNLFFAFQGNQSANRCSGYYHCRALPRHLLKHTLWINRGAVLANFEVEITPLLIKLRRCAKHPISLYGISLLDRSRS